MDLQALTDYVRNVRSRAADGMTLAEVAQSIGELARIAVEAAEQMHGAGPRKKEVVMSWLGDLIEIAVPAIPLPVWLRPVAPIVRAVLTRILSAVADGIVEAAVESLD